MRASLLTFLLLLLCPQIVAAQALSVAIFSLDAGKPDAVLGDTLTSVVRNEALQSGRYEVVNKFPIQMEDIALLAGCSAQSPSCLKQVASEVEARILIYGTLRRPSAEALQIEVNVFDSQSGQMLNRLTRTLPASQDPVVGFRREIELFFGGEKVAAVATRLQVGSNVLGAQVSMNGEVVGVTPLERRGIEPGTYAIRVTHDGHQPWETQVRIDEGGSAEVWAKLAVAQSDATVEAKVVEPPPNPPARRTNWVAWSAISVGALSLGGALVTGATLESTESTIESESAAGTLTEARYQKLYDRGRTLELAHRITLGVGIAGVAIGGVMLVLDAVGDTNASVAIGPTGISTTLVW